MLVSLNIKNFAIVKDLEVHWHHQMTTITGETGAGKSIAIDALALTLGERSESSMVRNGADKAEVCADFNIKELPEAKKWLTENDLAEEDECLLRRVISKEGRSKGYINGRAVPASSLKQLGNILVSIHGQHAHQLLTKPEHQCQLLDNYGGHQQQLTLVQQHYKQWTHVKKRLAELRQIQQEASAQQQLLQYQVTELEQAQLVESEFSEIENQHKRLHHAQTLRQDGQHALSLLTEDDSGNAYQAIYSAINILSKAANIDENLTETVNLLDSAMIQLQEGSGELKHYLDNLNVDEQMLFDVEQRLNLYMDLSRKHQVQPDQLWQLQLDLSQQLQQISQNDDELITLESQLGDIESQFFSAAKELHQLRQNSAAELNKKITNNLQTLNMAGAKFEIQLTFNESMAGAKGCDKVEFLVCANLGQTLQPLAKVASGGELSRISLAIQVIIAQRVTTPTLLFDEVDVGVSGPTASAVGQLMRQLSNKTQVICVTHLPQVASFGHQQQFVKKQTAAGETQTRMEILSESGRIDELARLLGGNVISDTTRANAKELLRQLH